MSQPYHILIVEDELLIAEHLAACLEDDGYVVGGIATSFEEAIELIVVQTPDLVLLDINLEGDLDGIDLANELRHKFQIPHLFVTSNTDDRTIARAKLTNPKGYLVKPFQPQDLRPGIEIALYNSRQRPIVESKESDSFFIKEKHEMKRVFYHDIEYAEAADNYTILHTSEKKYMLSQTLKAVEQKLIPHGFLRVHRSYVANIHKINCVRPTEVLVNHTPVPTSNNARQELLKYINTF